MSELVFEKFPKIGRLKRMCTISEKIDGTNSQLAFDSEGNMLVGARKREIWPEGTEDKPKGCDNHGFARWAYANQEALFAFLGEGRHYGEWCGCGIQRKYGADKKYFLLFNTSRWDAIPSGLEDIGLGIVPVLYEGTFTTDSVTDVMCSLKEHGSRFTFGFMNPEGVVVYHHASRTYFKVTFDGDDMSKWEMEQR